MYSLQELEALTGVPLWSIHYWIKKGVVPHAIQPPGTKSRRLRYYTPDHIHRIREVIAIREQNMTIADIRDRFNPEPDDE